MEIPAALLDCIRARNLVGIRAGRERRDFLDIWMVVVERRVFARSWGLSERSWYTTLLAGAPGAIRCGDAVLEVHGRIPPDLAGLTPAISAEYLRKYDRGENSAYARGIVEPQHVARTLEFVAAAPATG